MLAEHDLEIAGTAVLDFGCGTGLLSERLVDVAASITAVDTSPAMLAIIRRKAADRGWTNVTPRSAIPADGTTFDLVVCSSVCSFLEDYPGTVAELAGRLRPGGVFVQWDWERTGDDPHGLGRDEIRAALAGAGLHDVDVRTAFSVQLGGEMEGEMEGETMRPLVGHGRRPRELFR